MLIFFALGANSTPKKIFTSPSFDAYLYLDSVKNEKYRIKLIDLFYIVKEKYFFNPSSYGKRRVYLNELIFKEMLNVAKENDAKLIFYFIPIAWEVNNFSTNRIRNERIMFKYCKRLKIECYSSRSEFIEYNQRTGKKMKETGHWTEEGHKAVFRSMSKLFKNENE